MNATLNGGFFSIHEKKWPDKKGSNMVMIMSSWVFSLSGRGRKCCSSSMNVFVRLLAGPVGQLKVHLNVRNEK